MKNWYVGVEQKTKKSGDSLRTKKRDKKNEELGIVKKKVKKKNSLKSCVDYLLSKKHENHVHTQIFEIGNARQGLNNILDEVGSVRLKNAATSFCASIPADLYHPSIDEWENIYNETMENYCNSLNEELEKLEKAHHKKSIPKDERRKKEYHLNTERYAQRLDLEEMKRLSICVIHDDRDKPLMLGKTSGSQMNLLISNVIDNKVVKLISQKNGVELFKKSYVQAVKNELGIDPKNYLTYEERPKGKEHKDFYHGPSNVELLEIESSTPRKKRVNQELRLKDDKKSHYQATNEKHDSLVVREKQINKKLEQVPQAKKLIKTANQAIGAKRKAVSESKVAKAQTAQEKKRLNEIHQNIGVSEKRLKKVNNQLKNNEQWLYKVIQSDIVQKRIETLKTFTNNSMEFYVSVKKFIKGLDQQNEEFLNDLEQQNPAWLKREKIRLEREEQLKEERKANRHTGNVFVEKTDLKEELKEDSKPEIKEKDEGLIDKLKRKTKSIFYN
ncbi:hypothetical protein [Vibrio splendidus]|uniref:hypothetical protein n=1 Tax=Vibrio splendidus TaxID=29497 RepID=UPI003D0FDDC3